MSQIASLIIAISKILPVVQKLLEELFEQYKAEKRKRVIAATNAKVEKVIKEQDQRELEHETISGKPTGIGTIRTSLPGVMHKPKKD